MFLLFTKYAILSGLSNKQGHNTVSTKIYNVMKQVFNEPSGVVSRELAVRTPLPPGQKQRRLEYSTKHQLAPNFTKTDQKFLYQLLEEYLPICGETSKDWVILAKRSSVRPAQPQRELNSIGFTNDLSFYL